MLETFLAALGVVFTMLIYAVPGFLLVKTKIVKENNISAFAKLLMYASSPCLVFSSITRSEASGKLLWEMIITLALALAFFLLGLLIFFFVFRKRSDNVKYRIYNLATTLANCAFMGVPVLEALLPNNPEAVTLSAMFSLALNVIIWSVGAFIISRDRSYMSIKKILLNPAVIALVVAIPFFAFKIELPSVINDPINLLAKMSAPLCMLIMGMRLACASFKGVFLRPAQYLIIFIKQMVFPLAVLLILLPLPLDPYMKATIYIITACPVASVILSFAEMIGEGQESAANLVLLGTSLSAVTIPIMSLLLTVF